MPARPQLLCASAAFLFFFLCFVPTSASLNFFFFFFFFFFFPFLFLFLFLFFSFSLFFLSLLFLALHYAARNGHHEVVRLLVAIPIVNAEQRDADGKRPLDLCREMQLGEWAAVEDILIHPDSKCATRLVAPQQSSLSLHLTTHTLHPIFPQSTVMPSIVFRSCRAS